MTPPEGVPKALVERMAAAICPNSRPEHKGVTYCIGCFKRAGEGLAAVIPEIQASETSACADDGISMCPKMAYSNKSLQRQVSDAQATIDALNERCRILVDQTNAAEERARLAERDARAEHADVERVRAECRHLHQDGLSRHDWHAKHCGAVDAADGMRSQIERVRAQLVRMAKSSDETTQRHGTALLHILDGEGAR